MKFNNFIRKVGKASEVTRDLLEACQNLMIDDHSKLLSSIRKVIGFDDYKSFQIGKLKFFYQDMHVYKSMTDRYMDIRTGEEVEECTRVCELIKTKSLMQYTLPTSSTMNEVIAKMFFTDSVIVQLVEELSKVGGTFYPVCKIVAERKFLPVVLSEETGENKISLPIVAQVYGDFWIYNDEGGEKIFVSRHENDDSCLYKLRKFPEILEKMKGYTNPVLTFERI